MMKLTKEDLRTLPPEVQEALGESVVKRVMMHEQLVERAGRGPGAWTAAVMGLVAGLALLGVAFPRILPIAIIAAIAFATFQVNQVHRRLDALMTLRDMEKDDSRAKGK